MITVVNASENNLKAVSLSIPTQKLIVVTGVSGSGKSTLVYDVIYSEARRRYLESFSSHARNILGSIDRPDVQFISGLTPAVALEQKSIVVMPRSTVGTLSEIYDWLRLLFARYSQSEEFAEANVSRELFSFNTEKGACNLCKGLGVVDTIAPQSLIKDAGKSISQGAFATTTPNGYIVYSQVTPQVLKEICDAEGFSVDTPWNMLTPEQQQIVLFGSTKIKVPFGKHPLESRLKWTGITAKPREEGYYKGIVPVMEEILKRDRNPNVLRFSQSVSCNGCHGLRLNNVALSFTYKQKNIGQLASLSVEKLYAFFEIAHAEATQTGEKKIIGEILKIASAIKKLGIGYLALSRESATLSGGETQRLRLAKLVNSKMRGILYVFDEPSVGLHPSEVKNLLEILYELKNNGNTVILVDHNSHVIKAAEWIIDIGPEAGENGGKILFNGLKKDFLALPASEQNKTLEYINRELSFKPSGDSKSTFLTIHGASANNLKSINPKFKLNGLNVITGVSGAGKTTLVEHTLAAYFDKKLNGKSDTPGKFIKISGDKSLQKLMVIDQKPIGKTPRSNPATYTGLSDEIRTLFADLSSAKALGFTTRNFSFNTAGGRCDTCEGSGYLQVGMQFLGSVEAVCPDCEGKQFKSEVLQVTYNEKSIADIYKFTVVEAFNFFEKAPKIRIYLQSLINVGLGYLKLNQRSSTLSGGEARRVKLAKELVKVPQKSCLYIMDEPSSGLHPFDIEILVQNLNRLINCGHTVILVEQHPLFIQHADHIIELGPESGDHGGEIVYQGPPVGILDVPHSKTAQALLGKIEMNPSINSKIFDLYNPIEMVGVSTHNLKNIDVQIPINKIIAVTGVSGSGKSSLVFDTLFKEGRQQYAENFSVYMRNRLNMSSDARFESIKGLMPTIAVDQKSVNKSERSTVGTMTNIYDDMRLLFARVGKSTQPQSTPAASHFSFNHKQGACIACNGLGVTWACNSERLIRNPEKPIWDGAMQGTKTGDFYGDPYGQHMAILKTVGGKLDINFGQPWNNLKPEEQQIALLGTGNAKYVVDWNYKRKNRTGNHQFETTWIGIANYISDAYRQKANPKRAESIRAVMKEEHCKTCKGARLSEQALQFRVLGKTIHEMTQLPVKELLMEFRKQVVVPQSFSQNVVTQKAAQIIAGSIINGLDILNNLGLGHLSLGRSAHTLSGGEGQRVRLATGIAQDISGVCFILDEPTTGLHPNDLDNLFLMLYELKRQGNTVVVCEHDPGFIKYSDHVIELGPKAGTLGGNIIEQGSVAELLNSKKSIIAKYLSDKYRFSREKQQPNWKQTIKITGAYANNLKHINLELPTNALIAITGVSGSGKSSIMHDVIYKSGTENFAVNCTSIQGLEFFEHIVYAEQQIPKGSALSTVAGYLNIMDTVKNIFAIQAKHDNHNLTASHFSLNSKLGTCPQCAGNGYLITALDFIQDVYELCPECKGNRFNQQVLNVLVNHKNIAQVLDLPLEQLHNTINHEKVLRYCKWAMELGLGYLNLGQLLNTLSGGEMQRLKLLKTILETQNSKALILLDEPTTGLHMQDVELLIKTFEKLVALGHTLVVAEHHKTVIQQAAFVVEMGPGAGNEGGSVISSTAG